MAEEIVKYVVSVDFDTALKKLNDFDNKMSKFGNTQNKIAKTNQKLANQHFKERDKHITKEYNNKIKREKDLSRAHVAAIKMNMKHDKKARDDRRKDVLGRRDRLRASRAKNLSAARNTFNRSSMALRAPTNAGEAAAKDALLESVAKAKTANKVREIVAKERERLRLNKQLERSAHKQNFLMQRMQSSSKQFAGNMISAFAVAGLGAGITRVGQDFEAVNNTMLAVSTNAQEAGQNFKFVRDESFRLGLSLKDSGKNFAKMLSARGKMSLEDTKKAFSGISEMSTLLGLSAEESTRAKVCGSFNSNIKCKTFLIAGIST
jgi:hypothetical protein